MFKQEFEWLTSNTKVAYPFVERVDTPTGSSGDPFSDLVVDAYLTYKTDELQDVRLHSLGEPLLGGTAAEFRFADNSVAFSSAGADFKYSTMGLWTLLEWTTDEGAARVLLETSKIADFTWPVAPTDAYLVGHALQPIQTFVNTLTAEGQIYDGTVELVAGYNIGITERTPIVAEASARRSTEVQISAVAGEGLGTYPDCDFDTPPIFTINGIGPDDQGNFKLDPRDCYRGEIPITNPLTGPPWRFMKNAWKLFNDCSPCCECEDYIYVYNDLLRRVYDRAKVVSDRFYRVRDDYKALYDRIVEQRACREEPQVDLRLTGRHGWCVAVQVVVYNNGPCETDSITIDLAMSGPTGSTVPDAQRIDTDYVEHKPFTLVGSWPNYSITFTDGVRGARSLTAKFEIYFPIGSGRYPGAPISGTATGTVSGVAVSDDATTRLTQVFNKS